MVYPTICEAALATSAATGLFDPVTIGCRRFVDAALGANNPVDEVEGEATDIWCPQEGDLKPIVKCFISLGTGRLNLKAVEDNLLKFISGTLKQVATETEETAKKFIDRWRGHYADRKYFRFNVEQGLQEVGLKEYREIPTILAATDRYLSEQQMVYATRTCVENLERKQSVFIPDFS